MSSRPFSRPRPRMLALTTASTMSGNNVRMSHFIVRVAFQESRDPSDGHQPARHIHLPDHLAGRRDKMLSACRLPHHKHRIGPRRKNIGKRPDRRPLFRPHRHSQKVVLIVSAIRQRRQPLFRNLHQASDQRGSGFGRLDSLEGHEVVVRHFPARADIQLPPRTGRTRHDNFRQRFKPVRHVGERLHLHLAAHPVHTQDLPDGDQLALGYSRISNTHRFPNLVPAAFRIVRIDRAVRPCLPITLPRSSWATRSSMIVVFSPSVSRTDTSSGLSTRAFAMSSISALSSSIAAPPPRQRCGRQDVVYALADAAFSCLRTPARCSRVWTVTDGWAPFLSHSITRSCLIATAAGVFNGSYVPRTSMYRPSLGILESAATIR